MLKNLKLSVVFSILIAIILCFIFTDDFSVIHKTYGIDIPIEVEISEDNEANIVKDLREKYSNNEIVGLLEIPNTDFKKVVTKGSDNKKYLRTNAYGKSDIEGNPFLDYRVDINDSQKLLIYGHNAKDLDAPFKYLESYENYDFFKEHQYITIITDKKKETYQVFSVHVETSDWGYMKIDFKSKDDWLNHLTQFKNRSMYDTGVQVTKDDSILILQTCSKNDHYKNFNKKYLLIISRRVDEYEKTFN